MSGELRVLKRIHKPQIDTVGVGTTPATLAELLGGEGAPVPVADWALSVTLVAASEGVLIGDGRAGNDSLLPLGTARLTFVGGRSVVEDLLFSVADGSIDMTILQEG